MATTYRITLLQLARLTEAVGQAALGDTLDSARQRLNLRDKLRALLAEYEGQQLTSVVTLELTSDDDVAFLRDVCLKVITNPQMPMNTAEPFVRVFDILEE